MAKYEVLERSFINGRLCEKGAVVDLEIDSPGTNLRPVGLTQMLKDAIESGGSSAGTGAQQGGPQQTTTDVYTVKHNGGTRWVVVDAHGEKVGEFVGTSKEEAQAEAKRLNAGGEPYLKPTGTAGTTGAQQGGGDDDDDGPDA